MQGADKHTLDVATSVYSYAGSVISVWITLKFKRPGFGNPVMYILEGKLRLVGYVAAAATDLIPMVK